MSVDQWVNAIPFSETREYVQAVLAYDVIYRIRSGRLRYFAKRSRRAD